ncbi:MAG: PH domain-containing protein [Sciscionella sp.]|nr:PH domain-containing protein [Sciscionella sp.]
MRKDWAPSWALVAIGGALTSGFAIGAVLSAQATGRVLLAVAALAASLLVAHGAVVRPRLSADADGLTVGALGGRREFCWPDVEIRLGHTRRLGRVNTTLELDGFDTAGVEHLVILGRIDLGADPVTVFDELSTLRRPPKAGAPVRDVRDLPDDPGDHDD